jgi:cell division septation protein DedD
MIPKLTAALVAAAVIVLSACSQSEARHIKPIDSAHDATALAGKAKGEVIVIGTLATIGSFEWGTAPLATLAAASLKHIPQMLHDKTLTTDEAQSMINGAVKVRDLLKKANATCKQNGAGKCAGSEAKAQALADQAKAAIIQACLSLSDQEILTCLHR